MTKPDTANIRHTMNKITPIIEFKHPQLEEQFPYLDKRLQVIIYTMAGFSWTQFGKSVTMTELFRTQTMQDEYYKSNVSYQIKPWKSVHQFNRGADCSVLFYTDNEIETVVEFLNHRFIYGSDDHKTAVYHDIGLGKHIHLQVSVNDVTLVSK